jgi:H/ACA ribonucleoprotein complex subunit 3
MTDGLLRICRTCGGYTLHETCPNGHGATRSPHPARFSPSDRYGEYRRRLFAEAEHPAGAGA